MTFPGDLHHWFRRYAGELRHALRVTVAALVAFTVAHTLGLPQGYWAVFTAMLVTQASVGGSVKAAIDWFVSTLGGGAYAALVGTLIPKTDPIAMGCGLAIAVAPLAFLAGVRQTFRFAPITGGIVILVAPIQHVTPLESATNRIVEIALGGLIGLVVSLLILPARAQGIMGRAAARALDAFAEVMPLLLKPDRAREQTRITALHDAVLGAIANLTAAVDEAKRERTSFLSNAPDPYPLLRTLQRLRSDIVMVGRATAEPFPETIGVRLSAPLEAVITAFSKCLRALGESLVARSAPPSVLEIEQEMARFAREMAAVREAQLTTGLSVDAAGRIFAVGFALEQLKSNVKDMIARAAERAGKTSPSPQPLP